MLFILAPLPMLVLVLMGFIAAIPIPIPIPVPDAVFDPMEDRLLRLFMAPSPPNAGVEVVVERGGRWGCVCVPGGGARLKLDRPEGAAVLPLAPGGGGSEKAAARFWACCGGPRESEPKADVGGC
jgi:hypothetical protein